jgi:hypothetical protein
LAEQDFAGAYDGGGVGGELAGGIMRPADVAGDEGEGQVARGFGEPEQRGFRLLDEGALLD